MSARLLALPLDLFHSTPPCRREKKRVILFYKEHKEQRNWAGDKQQMHQCKNKFGHNDIPYL